MSSFSAASVAGVPIGLILANTWSWHAPFLLIVGLSLAIGALGAALLPAVRAHLAAPSARAGARGLGELRWLLAPASHRWSLAMMAALVLAGFTMVPYIATALVANAGFAERHLPWMYLTGGATTLVTSRLIGKLADRWGPFPVFWRIAAVSIFPILGVAYLVPIPMGLALLLMATFMVFMSGRFIVGTTLIHNAIDPARRGGFLSLMTAFQQAASGAASLIGGMLISKADTGAIVGLPRVGWFATCCAFLSVWLASRIRVRQAEKGPTEPALTPHS
jgi:predicted MFS family arabinose efflux permease